MNSRTPQGWEFAHCSFAHSLISSEQLWVIRSDRSRQMSDCEQIAQVPHIKRGTVSNLLKSLTKKERKSDSLINFWLKNLKSYFLYVLYTFFYLKKWAICSFPLFWWAMWANCSGCSPKMSDVSKLLRLLTKNEWPWTICSGRSEEMSDRERIAKVAHQKLANEWIAHFFERSANSLIFGKKPSDSLGKPMSEFPALENIYHNLT